MNTQKWLIAGLLVLLAGGMCWAETVNINPHKIVLNAQGAFDNVQANVPMVLPSSQVIAFDVTLAFNDIQVAVAESARYCLIDDMLIIGFDRVDLQNNPDVQAMGNSIVTAEVDGSVTVGFGDGDTATRHFSGTDMVEIVAPGAKGR